MHLAIDVAVWRIRPLGALVLAGAAAGALFAVRERSLPAAMAAVPLAIAGVALALRGGYLVRREAVAVQRKIVDTLRLLGLPHSVDSERHRIEIAGNLSIRVRPLLRMSLLTFESAGASTERADFLSRTLVKYQRTIHVIL